MMQIILSPQAIGSLGLVADIIGALLLFKYGLPENISREGHGFLVANGAKYDAEKVKARHYDRMGALGMWLLIGGFVLQLAGNLMQLHPGQ